MINESVHVGIGFATGRKSFKSVLEAYVYHLDESKFLQKNNVKLSLFVAYDLEYSSTKREDYTSIPKYILDKFEQVHFISKEDIAESAKLLIRDKIITEKEKELCFGYGYAANRNIILYRALQENVDYLLFMDDDEYPMAVTKTDNHALWSGQHVIEDHIKYLKFSDITNGYHCGYKCPIPYMEFDNVLKEQDFKMFIEALSNEVLNWDVIKDMIQAGGITYADKNILINKKASLVPQINNAKFITGGNLGINLTNPSKIHPFYNPKGARGEDTFLSTCLKDSTVKSIPTYTFHDGFSIYGSILKGSLPINLKKINSADSKSIIDRFYKTCVGWIRYKPLYTYITRKDKYNEITQQVKTNLKDSVPKVCAYFNDDRFKDVEIEFQKFHDNVEKDFEDFQITKNIWENIKNSIF